MGPGFESRNRNCTDENSAQPILIEGRGLSSDAEKII